MVEFRALSFGETPGMFTRPCVDCGRITGNFCENECQVSARLPSERWELNQRTPQCTECEAKYILCHYCRKVSWCIPFTHNNPVKPNDWIHSMAETLATLQEHEKKKRKTTEEKKMFKTAAVVSKIIRICYAGSYLLHLSAFLWLSNVSA